MLPYTQLLELKVVYNILCKVKIGVTSSGNTLFIKSQSPIYSEGNLYDQFNREEKLLMTYTKLLTQPARSIKSLKFKKF